MESNNSVLLDKALSAHKNGDLKLAKKLYLTLIQNKRDSPIVHNNLGTIFLSKNKSREALKHFEIATKLDTHNIKYISNLAAAHKKLQNFSSAADCYLKAFNLKPNDTTTFIDFIINNLKAGRLNDTVNFLSRLEIVNVPEILVHCILITYALDDPMKTPILKNSLGAIFKFFSDESNLSHKDQLSSIRISGNDCFIFDLFDKLSKIGFFHKTLDQILSLTVLATCNQEEQRLLALKGLYFQRKGDLDKSITYLKESYKLDTKYNFAIENLAYSLALNGEVTEATSLSKKHSLRNIVVVRDLLDNHYFKAAWKIYLEHRLHNLRNPGLPLFKNINTEEKTILLYRDQGIGDEIMFLSCLPDLINCKPRKIIYECDPRLEKFIKRSFKSSVTCIPISPDIKNDNFTWLAERTDINEAIKTSSLPSLFRLSLDSFYHQESSSFLKADPNLQEFWLSRLSTLPSKLNIGFAWKGGVNFKRGFQNNQLHLLKELLQLPNINWINMQYGHIDFELNFFKNNLGIELHTWDDIDYTKDLDHIAALSKELDLLIQVNNTSLHLAGAVGSHVWAILPFSSYEIRWFAGHNDSDCPWYPNVKLFRQHEGESLDKLVQNLTTQLKLFIEKS